MGGELFALISVPIFTGAIGYVTNWSGVWMLFEPVEFKGVRVPGVAPFVRLMPRKVQQIPGVMQGGVGWQGIIPSRAAKMGSIAVDKGIAKVGDAASFYKQLGSDRVAQQIIQSVAPDLRELVDEHHAPRGSAAVGRPSAGDARTGARAGGRSRCRRSSAT